MTKKRLGALAVMLALGGGIMHPNPALGAVPYSPFSAKDHDHLNRITDTINTKHKISDKDLVWSLQAMHFKPIFVTQPPGLPAVTVLERLEGLKSWSPSQERTCFTAVYPLLSSNDPAVRGMAAVMLSRLHDKRALAKLKAIAETDPNAMTRTAAKLAIARTPK